MNWNLVNYLKDYCFNSTLTGFNYIANDKLHLIERIFWLTCIGLSIWGALFVIDEYQDNFENSAVSIVYDNVYPLTPIEFPSVAVCDLYNEREINEKIEQFVISLAACGIECYSFDVEMHLNFILYPYNYHAGIIKGNCADYLNCQDDCIKCPENDYRRMAEMFSANCSSIFAECSLAHQSFDCCTYFREFITPFGKCFLFNSLQNNYRGSKFWFNSILNPITDEPLMVITARRPFQITVLNNEDIPHYCLPMTRMDVRHKSTGKDLYFKLNQLVNDVEVRDLSPEQRQCFFIDELLPGTVYKAYSFSSCLLDCVRNHQLNLCNCTAYSMLPKHYDKYPDCDLNGYFCLEKENFIKISTSLLLPWPSNVHTCDCLPSCTENVISTVYESSAYPTSSDFYNANIKLLQWPGIGYRRQALRTRLDTIVFIGGILGTFLGASLLSVIEFIYYFTLRLLNNSKRKQIIA